jgi:hypothetical protein
MYNQVLQMLQQTTTPTPLHTMPHTLLCPEKHKWEVFAQCLPPVKKYS